MNNFKCSLCDGNVDGKTKRCQACGMSFLNYKELRNHYNEAKTKKIKYIVTFVVFCSILFVFSLSLFEVRKEQMVYDDFYIEDYNSDDGFINKEDYRWFESAEAIYGETNELLSTAFFDFKVKDAFQMTSKELSLPIIGDNKCIGIEIYVKNTLDESILMFREDFALCYGEEFIYPLNYMEMAEQLNDEYYLDSEEAVHGKLYYIIPADVIEAKIEYVEYFDDDSIGNAYYVNLELE